MSTRLGIFGGTFDPPHIGHLILAAEAYSQLALTRLLWVLTANPPHKIGNPISPLEDRLEMLRLAMGDEPAFQLSRIDIDRPGPHYTLDTIGLLRKQHPGSDLVLIIGGDSLHDLPTWHRPADVVAACDEIGVMHRPNDEIDLNSLEKQIPGLRPKIRYIDAPLLEISSHEIRERVAARQPFKYYVPVGVYEYITQHNIYLAT